MATSAREDLYKYKGTQNLNQIKLAAKTSVKNEQTRNRDQVILSKRLKVESLEEAEAVLSREEELEKDIGVNISIFQLIVDFLARLCCSLPLLSEQPAHIPHKLPTRFKPLLILTVVTLLTKSIRDYGETSLTSRPGSRLKKETFVEHRDQFYHIISSVITKLSQVIQLEDSAQRDKVILPYLHSLSNMIGLGPDMALTACDNTDFLPTIFSCLTSNTDFIQKEALWILVNFMADPSCRVLVMCQPQLLSITFQLCQSTDESLALNALYLLDASSEVSTWMCRFLVEHKAVSLLVNLLANPRLKVLEAALDILVYLVTGTELGMTALLAADGLAQLQAAALKESILHLKETISTLLQSLQTQEAS